jgi:hypothetical protein
MRYIWYHVFWISLLLCTYRKTFEEPGKYACQSKKPNARENDNYVTIHIAYKRSLFITFLFSGRVVVSRVFGHGNFARLVTVINNVVSVKLQEKTHARLQGN